MQGAPILRSEAYLQVRLNDSPCEINPKMNLPLGNQILSLYLQCGGSISQGGGEAQRRRWTFYEAIRFFSITIQGTRCLILSMGDVKDDGNSTLWPRISLLLNVSLIVLFMPAQVPTAELVLPMSQHAPANHVRSPDQNPPHSAKSACELPGQSGPD